MGGKHTKDGTWSIPETGSGCCGGSRPRDPAPSSRSPAGTRPLPTWAPERQDAEVRARGGHALSPGARHARGTRTSATSGCTLPTSDADARDTAENKKERPRTPQTGLRQGREPSHSPSRRPGAWGRRRQPRREGSGPARVPVTRLRPGRGPRAGKDGEREGGQGGPGAAHSPPAAAPAAPQRCPPGSGNARCSPAAAGLAPSPAPRRARRAAASPASAAASPRPRTAPAAWGGGGAASAGRRGRGRARTPAPRCARPSPGAGVAPPPRPPSPPPPHAAPKRQGS